MPSEIIYSVFVSSTYEDLRQERAAVQKALLQLHCMPIGMELFGSADEETWDFIKRRIENCDYYVVIVADKYGSIAADGLSFTEKEYEYAREIKKPVLAFIHGNRGSIPRDRTEQDLEKRLKLEAFIEKVQRSPVSFFVAPDDLATQVTVSFVNLRERQPAVGFIRANQAPDLKKYTDLLEENVLLRAEVTRLKSDIPSRTLTELERPYVFVFFPHWAETDRKTQNYIAHITYNVANYGKTLAIITNVRSYFAIDTVYRDQLLREDERHGLLSSPIMQAGENRGDLKNICP
jgi:hypothetical protein